MTEILIQSKITTPRLSDKIVHRERLTSLIQDNKDKNLIIVCAPAGFGKTTLVLDFLSGYKYDYTWFSIPHKGIDDPSTFFEYIIGAIRKLNEKFGNTSLDVMKMYTQNPQISKELVYACTASLVNEFSEYFKEDVILVIDDLHYITSEKSQKWLKEFFDELLDNIPSNLHLILATRTIPDITLTQLKAKRNVLIIDENYLSFSEEETEALLDKVYKYKYEIKDIKLLDKNIKGWITGLHLLLQAYGEDFVNVNYSLDISFENIYDFFAQEIFNNLSPELQEFMMVTSLMESFDEELANSVLGITNSKELTDELIHKNLFIHQIHTAQEDKKTISYGYHALFREFLNRKLKDSRIEKEIKDLMEKIGDWYQKTGDKISAINYFMDVKNYSKSILLIKEVFQKIYNNGKYDTLWNWLNAIPEDIIEKNESLLYEIGYLYTYTYVDHDKALCYLYKAQKMYNFNNNEEGAALCIRAIATNLFDTGKLEKARTEFEENIKKILSPVNLISISSYLWLVYCELREFTTAIDLLEKALDLCNTHNLDKTSIYTGLAGVYFYKGDFKKSILYHKKVYEYHENFFNKITINCNIGTSYNALSDYENAIKYYKKAIKLLHGAFSIDREVFVYSKYALLLQNIGDYEESTKILEYIYPKAEKLNVLKTLNEIADYLFANNYVTGNQINCLKYLNYERAISNSFNNKFYNNLFIEREAMYEMRYCQNIYVEEKLNKTYKYYKSINSRSQYHTMKLLSEYNLHKNNKCNAINNLEIFLKESGFDASDLNDSRELIDFALSCTELIQYKEKIHYAFTEFFDRLNIKGTSDEYKAKMKIEIDKLFDINMKSFGTLEFIFRGQPVPESKWKRKKAKSILAYMMLDPKAKYSRDKIIDMFLSGSNVEKNEEIFKHEIFAIRSAFKLQYLDILMYEDKMLYLNPDCYFKSDAVEFNKYYKLIKSSTTSNEEKIRACKNAIELYKGDFMVNNYEPWCEDLRDEFKNKFMSISETLISLLSSIKDYEGVIQYSENLLKHDKLNELAYLNLVEAHVLKGKRKAAKDIYSKMLKSYKDELSASPDRQIMQKINSMIENR